MQTFKIPLTQIKISDRLRKDLGNVEELADSLDRYGLIQPIVLDPENNLIAGGRRCAAAQLLEWTDIKAVYMDTLSDDEKAEIELEENVRRKEMHWTERVCAIATIHGKKIVAGNLKWGYAETGELLGMAKSQIAYALSAAKAINAGDEKVKACGSLREALELLMERKADEALALNAVEAPSNVLVADITQDDRSLVDDLITNRETHSVKLHTYNEDCLSFMQNCINANVHFDHIITDPPYAIDMAMLQQENMGMNVERTSEEHDVEENKELLPMFLHLAFESTKDGGYCILWCDFEQWKWLADIADRLGWRTQRWPLLWIKTDQCQNGSAQFNFTKKTECALVLRKPNATLALLQSSNYWVGPGEDKQRFYHPFAKPLDLWKWLIEAVSIPGQTILDPFAGSGTCPCACIQMHRVPVAVEKKALHYPTLVENMKATYQEVYGPGTTFQ